MSSTNDRPVVALASEPGAGYPLTPPFDPGERYPELDRLRGGHPPISATPNRVFGLVRDALAAMGLDAERVGTADWNPLRDLVPQAGLVVVKPNLVLESPPSGYNAALVTHGSVVRALLTYVRLASAEVEILIGDVPLQGADFEQVVRENGLADTVRILIERGDARLSLHDLRRERAMVDSTGYIAELRKLPGDPRGYVEVDVGPESRLEGLAPHAFEAFAVSDYRPDSTVAAHAPGRHRYLIPKSVLTADLVVNVPKLKTHQKAGLTVAIKNLVGVNGDKARIPHFRVSAGRIAGDEYPPTYSRLWTLRSKLRSRLQGSSRVLFLIARQVWRMTKRFVLPKPAPRTETGPPAPGSGSATLVSGGAWYGNDTLWRALHDLNLILLFAATDGRIRTERQRKYLCVVDGIVAGEGDGPLLPIPRNDGIVLAAMDALATDFVAARYMGMDWRQIPTLARGLEAQPRWSAVRASIEDDGIEVRGDRVAAHGGAPPFLPPPGWIGRVERDLSDARARSVA